MTDTATNLHTLHEPPHADDVELAVLGAIFINNSTMDHVADILREPDFYRAAHQRIFIAMKALYGKREPIDSVTLVEELERAKALDAVGGLGMIASLGTATPTSANATHYAKIVRQKSVLRKLIAAGQGILSTAHRQTEDVDEVVDQAVRSVLEVAQDTVREDVVSLEQIIHETIDHLGKIAQSGEFASGVPTGFMDLDHMTNGFQPGDLIILAARPAMGKTSFALNCAQYAASPHGGNKSVLFFSLEMSRASLGLRLLCSTADLNLAAMRSAQMIEAHYARLVDAASALYETRLYIDDTSNISVGDIRSIARRLKAEKGLDMIIIDYIQLMRAGKNVQSREQEIAQISRSLKQLAKELEVPVIALGHLNRMVEQRPDKRPRPADLRESGALEQDADLILFIYRDEVYNEDTAEPGVAEIIIGKQRNGPTGTAKLGFHKEVTRFVNLSYRRDVPESDGDDEEY